MDISLILLVASVAVGLFVGVFSGLIGVGGGTILVPAFRLLYGLDPLAATATSLLTIIPTSVSGAITHIRNKSCIPAVGVAAGLGGACTSWMGVWLADRSPAWCVMAAAAAVIFYSAYNMFKKAAALKKPKDGQAASAKTANEKPVLDLAEKSSYVKMVAIGAAAGVISGYVGVGGGFIMVPLFLSVLGLPMKKASGTSLIAVCILAVPATVMQFMLGNVHLFVGLAVVAGSIPGATIGARLQSRVPERTLRLTFACFLLVAGALLLVREAGLLG